MDVTAEDGSTKFLSTLPARGATQYSFAGLKDIYISIHAPREGSDLCAFIFCFERWYFYPRSPRGERPVIGDLELELFSISIHAPREGSD